MTEIAIVFECPKCNKYSNSLIRFKKDEVVTKPRIGEKVRRKTFLCPKCGHKTRESKLSYWKPVNPQEAIRIIQSLSKSRD